jgi:hypothetical protein
MCVYVCRTQVGSIVLPVQTTAFSPLTPLPPPPNTHTNSLHEPDLLRLVSLTGHTLRDLSVAKCDSITNQGLARLCLLCRLEALNVADCLRVDAGFVHLLAAAAAAAAATVTPDGEEEDDDRENIPPVAGGGGSSKPAVTAVSTAAAAAAAAAAAVAAANGGAREEGEEAAALLLLSSSARPAPLASLHSLNARQCRGWTDATTAALLSLQGCGARNLRRLYLGGTAGGAGAGAGAGAAAAGVGVGGRGGELEAAAELGCEEEEGGSSSSSSSIGAWEFWVGGVFFWRCVEKFVCGVRICLCAYR